MAEAIATAIRENAFDESRSTGDIARDRRDSTRRS
jgi:hypothetical protein